MIPMNPSAVSLFGVPPNSTLNVPFGMVSTPIPKDSGSMVSLQTGLGIGRIPDPGETNRAPFADLLTEAVSQVQHLEQEAKSKIEGLMSGKGVDVHDALIAAQKAGMGFELMLSVRNKALAAYQQVMGMQF